MHLPYMAFTIGIHEFQEQPPDRNIWHSQHFLNQAARTQGIGLAASKPAEVAASSAHGTISILCTKHFADLFMYQGQAHGNKTI
jgi:hypothetical protein